MKIFVTGGAGYIGSHTVLTLLENGFEVVVLDNLSNSSSESLKRVSKITGKDLCLIEGDIRDRKKLDFIFSNNSFDAVIHFAGLKSVGDSISDSLEYYDNNCSGTINLCQAMSHAGIYKLIFSSSATVYGDPVIMPIDENTPTGKPTNPYGYSKLMIEIMLTHLVRSDPRWTVVFLRYFNPVGAHESGMIGEDPNGIPNNLLPFITQVAVGKLDELSIFGNDYSTPDGTCIRDYIHVLDLAQGHLKALEALKDNLGVNVWNLGTGQGYSVMEMVRAFERFTGKVVPYRIAARRHGDVAISYANVSKANRELGWKANRGLEQMIRDSWNWQLKNPNGY